MSFSNNSSTSTHATIHHNNLPPIRQSSSSTTNTFRSDAVIYKISKTTHNHSLALQRHLYHKLNRSSTPGFARLLHEGEDDLHDGRMYLVLTDCGMDAATFVHKFGPLDQRMALRVIIDVARLIRSLHEHRYLHLDISPGNIVFSVSLTSCGVKIDSVTLVDFGSALRFQDSDGNRKQAKQRVRCGSVGFAPVAVHEGREVGPRDDFESLLYVLVFLTRGCVPWEGVRATSEEELWDTVAENKQSVEEGLMFADLPEDVTRVWQEVSKCAPQGELRYGDVIGKLELAHRYVTLL